MVVIAVMILINTVLNFIYKSPFLFGFGKEKTAKEIGSRGVKKIINENDPDGLWVRMHPVL